MLMGASVGTRRMSRNFDFIDIKSGQFCDVTTRRQWEFFQVPFVLKVRMGACYYPQDFLTLGNSWWPLCSSVLMNTPSGHPRSEVIWDLFFCLQLLMESRQGVDSHILVTFTFFDRFWSHPLLSSSSTMNNNHDLGPTNDANSEIGVISRSR